MSDDDPFGRRDRTIIRPNPGGRRPTPPAAAPPVPPSPGAFTAPQPPARPAPSPYQAPSYPPPPPTPAYPSAPAYPTATDAWMDPSTGRNLYQPPAAPDPLMPPLTGAAPIRLDWFAANPNPLMRAAGPLLLLLGRLRTDLSRASYAQLMDQVAQSIIAFEAEVRDAGVPPERANIAKYALCATADDIAQNLPTDDRHLWTQYSMLARFFGERTGGVRFFQELDRAKANPAVEQDLLELMHACLSLGFEGVHRTSAGGTGMRQMIRRDVYETLRRVRSKTIEEISPHWRGQAVALNRNRFVVPVWAVAAFAGVFLLGVYLLLRMILGDASEAIAGTMSTLHPNVEITIPRQAVTRPPPDFTTATGQTQIERIRAALAEEIAARKVSADQTSSLIVVRIGNLALFDSGKATVRKDFAAIADRIAATLDREPGTIRIIGHTDNVPIKTAFASNFALSEARAKSVAAMLGPKLADPSRITVEGKGADEPVASNKTAEGRAKNRRVEIVIPRVD